MTEKTMTTSDQMQSLIKAILNTYAPREGHNNALCKALTHLVIRAYTVRPLQEALPDPDELLAEIKKEVLHKQTIPKGLRTLVQRLFTDEPSQPINLADLRKHIRDSGLTPYNVNVLLRDAFTEYLKTETEVVTFKIEKGEEKEEEEVAITKVLVHPGMTLDEARREVLRTRHGDDTAASSWVIKDAAGEVLDPTAKFMGEFGWLSTPFLRLCPE
jgi:hypothetical protein